MSPSIGTLAVLAWLAAAASTPPARAQAGSTLGPLRVQVVRGTGGEPVSGAQVTVLDREDLILDAGGEAPLRYGYDWDDARARLGKRQTTDEDGIALVPRGRGIVHLSAASIGLWAQRAVWAPSVNFDEQVIKLELRPDRTLHLAVVGEDLQPRGGVPVTLFASFTPRGPRLESPEALSVVARSDELYGIVTFRHAQEIFGDGIRGRHWIARPDVPLAEPVQCAVVDDLAEPPPRLVLPPTGRVTVHLPGIAGGRTRLIVKSEADEPEEPDVWAGGKTSAVPILDGQAEFPFVGLGLTLEVEFIVAETNEHFGATFSGPQAGGEHVEFHWAGRGSYTTLAGQLLDEDRRPIASTRFDVSVTHSKLRGATLRTDSEGRFEFTLPETEPGEDGPSFFRILPWWDPVTRERSEYAEYRLEIDPDWPAGRIELGEVHFLPPGSGVALRLKDDAELEAAYRSARELDDDRRVETCLTEMARRGGARWIEFLSLELASFRKNPLYPEDGTFELLTALRRAQREPDPLALELLDPPPFECTFPETPLIRFRLRNVDRETFHLQQGGNYRSGRFARCRVMAVDEAGREAPPPGEQGSMGGGFSSFGPFAPEEVLEGELPIGAYVQLPHPGRYSVRILYHDRQEIDTAANVLGWITIGSPEFEVRVHPLRVELTRAEHAELVRWVAALEPSREVDMVQLPWHPDLEVAAEPYWPEDHLFHAGWKALPALLEALEQPKFDAQHRGWVLGMLWNITGILHPTTREFQGALGASRWIDVWPGVSEEAYPSMATIGGGSHGGVDREAQAELTRRWLELRDMVELVLTD